MADTGIVKKESFDKDAVDGDDEEDDFGSDGDDDEGKTDTDGKPKSGKSGKSRREVVLPLLLYRLAYLHEIYLFTQRLTRNIYQYSNHTFVLHNLSL